MPILSKIKLKEKRCKVCKSAFTPIHNSTQIVCSTKCALSLAAVITLKINNDAWKEKKKAIKAKIKKLSEYEAEARKAFQAWVRKRDEKLPCISCGAALSQVWDGGHYLKAELFSGLIFDPDNCHKQCRRCNHFWDGQELAYRDGLIKRYGEKFVKKLEAKKDSHRNRKYTKQELIEIRDKYRTLNK